MSENLFQEFSDFEAKYVIHDDGKPLMNLEELEKENFEIISFISENFLLNKENSLINYVKLQEAFQIMHELQGKTLEEIAISVDLNLDRYMEVSKQFEQIKAPLIQINETFSQLKALLNDYKFGCQSSSKDLNELIGNKEILEIYEAEFVKLKEIRKEFIIIEEFLNNPSNFAFIFISRIFQKIFENLEALNHRIGDKVHILIEKYQLKELVQHHRKTFLKLIEGKMKELLSQIINPNQEINKEMKDDFMRFLNSYELLKESKKGIEIFFKNK